MDLRRLSAPIVAAAAAAAGCSEPLSACEQSVLPQCDVEDEACQAALGEHVACARGVAAPAEPLLFTFLGAAEFDARYGAAALAPDDTVACLTIAELWPIKATRDTPEATALFDAARRAVVVVDTSATTAILRAIVQGQRDVELGGFQAWRQANARTYDQGVALDALFAGEGWLYGDVAAYKTSAREDAELRRIVDANLEDYTDAAHEFYAYARSSSFDLFQLGPHFAAFGARFALKTFLARDPGALAEAFARPVRSGAELIRGRLTDKEPAVPEDLAVVPAPFTRRSSEQLGAWAYYSLLARADPPPPPQPYMAAPDVEAQRFADVAGRWAGDRFDCYTDPSTGEPLIVWDLAFDPTVSLDPFTITDPTLATWRWVERENSLTLVAGFDEAIVQAIADGLP